MEYSILPADKYKVINKALLSDIDKNYLMAFYSPIIGPLAISLYLNLWQDLSFLKEDEFYIHHHLMSNLKCSAQILKEARESLEAVGLLKTYVKEENVLVYLYELYAPLNPSEFLNHPILGVVLYNNIGEDEYDKLIKQYQNKKYNYDGYVNITKNMDDVYRVENFKEVSDIHEKETSEIKLTSKINYDQLMELIPKKTISERAFNKKTRELIDNLSFIYNVDTPKMVEFIRKSINEFGMIDKTVLRTTTRKYYQLSSNSLPTIVYRTQPEFLKKASGDSSLRAKAITMFENVSPYDFLKAKNKGANPTSGELKLIETLLVDLELTPAVVNVLVDYCLRISSNKLVPSFVESIASQWKRAGLKTAEDAMKFAEGEHKKKSVTKTSPKKEEEKPTWLNKKIEKAEVSSEDAEQLEQLLKEFK